MILLRLYQMGSRTAKDGLMRIEKTVPAPVKIAFTGGMSDLGPAAPARCFPWFAATLLAVSAVSVAIRYKIWSR